jgi:hypothetical protein
LGTSPASSGRITLKFPKAQRFLLAERVGKMALDFYDLILDAVIAPDTQAEKLDAADPGWVMRSTKDNARPLWVVGCNCNSTLSAGADAKTFQVLETWKVC